MRAASEIETIRAAAAFVDLSDRRKVLVTGGDAGAWLHDLLTADVEALTPGRSSVALLLTPTGRIRSVATLARIDQGFLLVQDPSQPDAIDVLLDRYVLSSDVTLRDVSGEHALFAVGGGETDPTWMPSALTWPGEVLADAGAADSTRAALGRRGLAEVPPDAVEAWRIAEGLARFPFDLTTESLPHEVEFADAIDHDKGCYLGQEAVARVRNLGHPPWVVRSVSSGGPVSRGMPVLAEGAEVGAVTSAAQLDEEHHVAIVRVRWAARDASLTTSEAALSPGPSVRGVA